MCMSWLQSFIHMCCFQKSSCCMHLSQLAWWNRLKAASAGGNQIPWWLTVDKNWPPERGQQKNAVHSTGQLEAWLDQDFCACKVAAATISCQEDLRGSCPLTSLLEDHVEFRKAKSYPKVNLWICLKCWIIQQSLHHSTRSCEDHSFQQSHCNSKWSIFAILFECLRSF